MLDTKIKRRLVALMYAKDGTSFILENKNTGEEIYIKKIKDGIIDLSFDEPTEKVYKMIDDINSYIEKFTKNPTTMIKYKAQGETIH